MPASPPPPDPAQVVLTFLESIGRPSEAQLYLRQFREGPKEQFGILVTESAVLRHAGASFIESLRFLHDLGLFAPVVIGAFEPISVESTTRAFVERAAALGPRVHIPDEAGLVEKLRTELRTERLPIVPLSEGLNLGSEAAFDWLGDVAGRLGSRKVVVLRRRGGLGPHGSPPVQLGPNHVIATHQSGLSIINATTDFEPLIAAELLDADDRQLLERLVMLVRRPDVKAVASVTSPLSVLQELFTQKGAGTLVKQGSRIVRHGSYDSIDLSRLQALLEGTFDATLAPNFFGRPVTDVYLEEGYRGAAIIEPAPTAAFLTKFAVGPIAQGEGMGRDLWQAIVRDHEALFWRARADNPVASWYATLADGTMRSGPWRVYFRGVKAESIPALIADAVARPIDFVQHQPRVTR